MPTFDTPEPITAAIELAAGNVRIDASDRTDTVVEVRPSDPSDDSDVQAAKTTRVEYANGRLSVRASKADAPRRPDAIQGDIRKWLKGWLDYSLSGWGGSVELVIALPAGSAIDAKIAGDVHSGGRLGEFKIATAHGEVRLDQTGRLRLSTASGDVSVARTTGHADVTTADGEIHLGEIDGSAVVKTSNGSIAVGEVTGGARLNTASGDITVERALADVEAKTAYGSVRIGEVVRGAVGLETSYGELEVGIREGTAAWLDVSSHYGGVRSELDAARGPEQSDDTVKIRARTSYGDIVIRRA